MAPIEFRELADAGAETPPDTTARSSSGTRPRAQGRRIDRLRGLVLATQAK